MSTDGSGANGPRRRPFRIGLIHLMMLVAAVALTIVVPPAFMQAVMRSYGPMSSWNRAMYLDGATTLALTSWSILLGLVVLVACRSRLQDAARSYGTSAVLASAAALEFDFAAKIIETLLIWWNHGWSPEWLPLKDYLHILGGMLHEIPMIAAGSIVAAWSILALTRVGRRPARLAEVTCLILGLAWLLWLLVGRFVVFSNPSWLRGEVPSWT